GSWTINSGGGSPTGITLDPTNLSQSLWIVDSNSDSVYEYANARGKISGSQAASVTFALASGNTNPQGIADPPAPSSGLTAAPASIVGNSAFLQAAIVSLGVLSTEGFASWQRVLAVTESVDEFMSQLSSWLPVVSISTKNPRSIPLPSRPRFADDQSMDLALGDEELNDSLHAVANDLLKSTLR
ncbi:MAG TPA: hypothetical protein VM260_17035, partial [Pirellula sp.]|nr:hypothetical protein [Pirellula sp.]